MKLVSPDQLLNREVLEIRGDGRAGGGLVLAMQSLAGLLISDPTLYVQEWPFFSSARKGAAIRSFLRVSRKPISIACEVEHPQISILSDAGAAHFVDFAEGVPAGGIFILNTHRTPEDCAKHYKLSGKVLTINGDELGKKYLKLPIGNVSVFAAMVKSITTLSPESALNSLLENFKKRRLPEPLRKANAELFNASLEEIHEGEFECSKPGDHELKRFEGYGALPMGAQSGLRLSRTNLTSNYARSGSRVVFRDPQVKCTGCSACIVNCPENIINFQPDPSKGILVTGANFGAYCKSCRECIESCPEKLFDEQPFEEKWNEIEGAIE